MRTTLNIDENIYEQAVKATGVKEKTKLLHMGLEELIRKAAYRQLASLRGAIKNAKAPPRRKYL